MKCFSHYDEQAVRCHGCNYKRECERELKFLARERRRGKVRQDFREGYWRGRESEDSST